jgi:uncharacterized protein YbjQ (UPF0145 family)
MMQDEQNYEQETIPKREATISGLSGNEMFCVDKLGYRPGNLLVGNSVYSMGFLGSIGSSFKTIVGGEVSQVTNIISEGRHLSTQRLIAEMQEFGGHGATGFSSELIFHNNNIEFLSVASTIHQKYGTPENSFTTAADGQELYCQVDAGYEPLSFVMGNVAYSIGVGRGIGGMFKQLVKGEVKQYSDIFTQTRNLALERIIGEAQSVGANAVVGINTSIMPFGLSGVHEMLMLGTASRHTMNDEIFNEIGVITSDLTAEEMWNLANLGYAPLQLVLGTSVYSMGFVGGFMAGLKNWVKGEISELTELIYNAREESLRKVREQATAVGADDVIGVKTYIYDIGGGLIEFLAIGTAIKATPNAKTLNAQLIPQAIIRDKNTFIDTAEMAYGRTLTQQ